MTCEKRKNALSLFEGMFNSDETTDEVRVAILTIMRAWAEEEMPESRCIQCEHTGVYAPYTYALIPGHCYSYDGMVDYTRITKVCEFCSDAPYVPRHAATQPPGSPVDGLFRHRRTLN